MRPLHGLSDLRVLRATKLFDPEEYGRRYPDVVRRGIDPAWHYLRYGAREGRVPGPLFDAVDYLARYPDVAASGMNPVVHYLRIGHGEGRQYRPATTASHREVVTTIRAADGIDRAPVVRPSGSALRLSTPVVSWQGETVTVTCDVDGAPSLRAVLRGPAEVLSRIESRIEPFLPVALLMAGAARCDLVVDGPVDAEFVTHLRLHCVPLLELIFDFRQTQIEISDPHESRTVGPDSRRADPAALLFSGGVDSFFSLARLRQIDYPLRLLVNVDAGAHCHRACAERRQERVRQFASESGYEALTIDTNFHEVVDADHAFAHPFRTLPAGYTAYPAIAGLFLSTGYSYHDLSSDLHKHSAEISGSTLPASIAWSGMPVTEIGYEARRFEKMRVVADEPLSYHALDVCYSGDHIPGGDPDSPVNCGKCNKCARSILTLDALGRLDRYRSQFDLSQYPANRDDLLRRVRRSDGPADRDLLARLYGHSPPKFGPMRLAPPSWAEGRAAPTADDAEDLRSPGPFKPPIRLYWWRGQNGVANAGDELSPLIVERVSGRQVIFSSPETCHLVAIGSLAEVALRADRDWPVRLWGTGFIGDGMTLNHRNHRVLIAALRGPGSAARLSMGSDVPLGDPGLLVTLLHDGRVSKVRAVGIIPGYSELDLPIIDAWRAVADAVISPHLPPMEFIEAIAGCDLILSSSLHGLVVADGLGVPNAWTPISDRVTGHGFKFRDYLRGVSRPEHSHRLQMPEEMGQTSIDDLVNGYDPGAVADIRERLLDAFPQF